MTNDLLLASRVPDRVTHDVERPVPGAASRYVSFAKLSPRFALLISLISIGCGDDGGLGPGDAGASDSGFDQDASTPGDGGDGPVSMPQCGDGILGASEECDDGNTNAGDGCAADCLSVEDDFACPREGRACLRVVTCGNARIEGRETCDDRNTEAGDGCDSACLLEIGWVCPAVGAACIAAACGDGLLAGFEGCDDGNTDEGDGCSASCQLEDGYACDTPGAPCRATTCGDGVAEGTEDCDDGNPLIGDGCTPFCTREPSCTDGSCTAVCGDEVVFAPETCDDGNVLDGDGCSADCQVEEGYTCDEVPLPDPPSLVMPVVIRDFIPACDGGSSQIVPRPDSTDPAASAPFGHPDFECFGDVGGPVVTGMVEDTLVGGVPARSVSAPLIESDASFALWYRSDDDRNRTVVQAMTLAGLGGGQYRFDSSSFFPLSSPIDGSAPTGFPTEGSESLFNGENFFFTSEIRFWFRYEGGEVLAFSGDDDVWVFINGRLAVDIGGIHGRADGTIELDDCASADDADNDPGCLSALGLVVGGIYEAVVFQAERHVTQSQYRLTLANFQRAPSTCASNCGDGAIASDEACDDGADNGVEYGGCSSECRLTPYCGDGIVQEGQGEVCDDGLNLGGSAGGCAPGCQEMGGRCGDGVVQTDLGEQCDDGNTEDADGCSRTCEVELI